MRAKVPRNAAIIVGATVVATFGVGVILLRDPYTPPSAPVVRATPPPAAPKPRPVPPPTRVLPPPDVRDAPAVAAPAPGSPASIRPCKVTREGDGPVADLCRQGGQDAAKKFMKAMVNRTKDRPDRVTCDTCHENIDDFTLQEGARQKLAELLASLPPTTR